MMYIMMPTIIPVARTFNDVLFWGLIGLLIAVFLLGTTLWIMGYRRMAQQASQVKEAEPRDEAFPQYQHEKPSQVHSSKEEILLRR